jgi:F-type H+-transporting ATPase subunit alpha
MKKVAGTLKLDQAQYRELEAFAKFGYDLDPATKAVLDKGARNVEILKQPQNSPMPVEKQIAIIYLGTKGLLKDIALQDIKKFEKDYLDLLEVQYKDTLNELKSGKIDDNITSVLEKAAQEVALKYKKS